MPIINANIEKSEPLTPPDKMQKELPLSDAARETVEKARETIIDILGRKDKRHLLITGPCSIHDAGAALEYAERLKALAEEVQDRILVVMRVYFEKPRTTVGWKGLIYDPDLNGSYDIEKGLRAARKILADINAMGLGAATEMLDPVIPQYIADLVAWAAIGARTTESQTHRQLASGLSMPVGFKNATDGGIQVGVDAIKTAASSHAFLGITGEGRSGIFTTRGNPWCHLVLRGGGSGKPNYGSEHIAYTRELLKKADLAPNIMVDCSHDNSSKTPERQAVVLADIMNQIQAGEEDIVGTMLESNLQGGRQAMKAGDPVQPGLSITDGCLGWEETAALIREVYAGLNRP